MSQPARDAAAGTAAPHAPARVALVFPALHEPGVRPPSVSNAEHLGLAYLAAALRAESIPTVIVNGELDSLSAEEVTERILASGATLVGLSPVSLSMAATRAILADLKRRRPTIRSVLGGHLATLAAEALMALPEVDMVLTGEGERSLPQLVLSLEDTGSGRTGAAAADLDAVPGLLWRDGAGVVRRASRPAEPVPVETLPPAARDDLDALARHGILSGARVLAGRGCQYDCSYCTTPVFLNRTVRYRPVAHVIAEIEALNASHGLTNFWLNDDLFVNGTPANTRWIEAFCAGLRGRGYRFRALCRTDSFRPRNAHLLGLLKEAGLAHVFLGLESGTAAALAVYNKHTTVQRNREAVALFKAAGLAVQIGYILYNPYSTLSEVADSARFLDEIGELYRFFPLTLQLSIFPGTPIAHRLAADGLLTGDPLHDPLTCFRYRDPAVARVVEVMRAFNARHHGLDAHILASLGYDQGGEDPVADGATAPSEPSLRRALARINLERFMAVLDAVAAGAGDAALERLTDGWAADLGAALGRCGRAPAPREARALVT